MHLFKSTKMYLPIDSWNAENAGYQRLVSKKSDSGR
jgi:hypothetical protein